LTSDINGSNLVTTYYLGGGKMPKIFKPLVTVSAWLMFILAWVFSVFVIIVPGLVEGEITGTEPPSMNFLVGLALSIGFAFAGGFLLLVRKKLE
jgi:hypothetical protein